MPFTIEDDPRDVGRLIAGLNNNLPVKRRSLVDYMDNGGNTFLTRSGTECSFDRAGIEYLDGLCTVQEKLTLRLPVFVTTDPQSEFGGWKVEGKTEVAVISRILGRKAHGDDYMSIYYADILELKKLIPGLIYTVFSP